MEVEDLKPGPEPNRMTRAEAVAILRAGKNWRKRDGSFREEKQLKLLERAVERLLEEDEHDQED